LITATQNVFGHVFNGNRIWKQIIHSSTFLKNESNHKLMERPKTLSDEGKDRHESRDSENPRALSAPTSGGTRNRNWIIIGVLIASLMLSNMIYQFQVADTFVRELSSPAGIVLYILLTIILNVVAIYLLKSLINPLNKNLPTSHSKYSFFRVIHFVLKVILGYNVVILAITAAEVVVSSRFHVGLSVLLMQANSVLTVTIFVYLTYKFLSWFKSNRDLAVLFFMLSFACVALGTATADGPQLAYFILQGSNRTEEIHLLPTAPDGSGYFQANNSRDDPAMRAVYLATQIPLRVAFILYWIASALLLKKYSALIGTLRFWVLVTLPVSAFIAGSIFDSANIGTQLLRGIVFPMSALAGATFFGLIFVTISKALDGKEGKQDDPRSQSFRGRQGIEISRYLTLPAFGTILFIVANTPPNNIIHWNHIPFPPFADVVWSFIGFAAYLYGFGLFISILSISHDLKLRKSLQHISTDTARMLSKLGSDQMQLEIRNKVVKIAQEQEAVLKQKTGIDQQLSEEEIQQYIRDVVDQVKNFKESGEKSGSGPGF
jgi:hypothetical protein